MKIGEGIDKVIGLAFPLWAARRSHFRAVGESIRAAASRHRSLDELLGGRNSGGYTAGKKNRLRGFRADSPHENTVPFDQIETLRSRSWNLYRNNPQARKISRTLKAKVIGRSLCRPQPQTVSTDNKPFTAFRKRARDVFAEFSRESDFRGKPGSGGEHFGNQCKTALHAAVFSGGCLYRFRHLTPAEQRAAGLFLPLQIQLIHIDRIDSGKTGDNIYRGVQVDSLGRVTGYWLLPETTEGESKFAPAYEVRHLYLPEDIDQLLGAPWLGATMVTADDRKEAEFNELVAIKAASCLVGVWKPGDAGTPFTPGLVDPASTTAQSADLVDADGNPVTHIQPQMLLTCYGNSDFDLKGQPRPNPNMPEFLKHLVRGEAVGMPGIKASTLTGDYRESSFSAERSADNDNWPELEDLQEWFALNFCQPIYDEAMRTAVLAGKFDDVDGFTPADFQSRQRDYLSCNWQGPVPRSINPKDDADASRVEVKNANSSPQIEAGKRGRDWREVLQDFSEFIAQCESLNLPPDIWQQALGIEQSDAGAADTAPRPTEQEQDEKPAASRLRSAFFSPPMNAG